MVKKLIFTIITFWIILFIIGLFVGEKYSPDFSTKGGVENFIEQNTIFYQRLFVDTSAPLINNLKPLIRKNIIEAKFDAGRYYYTYTENSNERPHRIANINYTTTNYKKGIAFDKLDRLLGIGVTVTGIKFNNAIKTITTSTLKEKAISIPIVLSGFFFGYLMTNNQNFDSDSPMAQSVLNDNVFWENVIKRHKIKNNSPN